MKLEFNIERLHRLLKSFYQLTGIRIVIFDIHHQEIASFPPTNCAFCKKVQAEKKGYECCMHSNEVAFEHCLKTQDLYTYVCHAGLIESMIHLRSDNTIVGFIMFGQITNIMDKEERYQNLVLKNNFEDWLLKKDVDDLVYIDDEKLQSVSTILLALAKYAISEKMVSIQQEKFLNDLNEFIDQHLEDSDLSAKEIAHFFHMSKTCFYTTMDKYCNMGIARYLKMKRLEKAKELLEKTDDSLLDITSKVGFSDYNYFCRVFKKEMHMSASEYRKSVRTNLQ